MEPAGKVCPLCGGLGREVEEPEHLTGLRHCDCTYGGVLLAWPHASVEAYEAKYRGDYHTGEMERTGRKAFVARDTEYLHAAHARLTRLKAAYPWIMDLLDLGSGTGALVAQAGAFGLRSVGLEPNEALVAWGKSIGRRVEVGTWEHANRWEHPFDAVTLIDVLEHLTDPLGALAYLRKVLAPEGVLVVEMPEYLAPNVAWQRHIKIEEHPCLYSREAAECLFKTAGYRVDEFHRPLGGELGKQVHYLRVK